MDITHKDTLFIIAEIAVLFAGFGGLSVVAGRLVSKIERVRLRNVIGTALMLVVSSLLPVMLVIFGIPESWVWRIGTGVLVSYTLLFYGLSGDLNLFFDALPLDRALIVGDWVLAFMQLCAAAAWFGLPADRVYVGTLYWHLVSACVMYMLVFEPIWAGDQQENASE